MINYHRGFKRIWIILWLFTSSGVLVLTCLTLKPNPAFPLATVHPKGVQEPLVKSFEELSDISSENISKWEKIAKRLDKEEHDKQVQAHSKWESELVCAFRVHSYWKNVGLTLLALGAWSALFWCAWPVGIWIIRGFISET